MKVFDFSCTDPVCLNTNTKIEFFIEDDEIPKCEFCGSSMCKQLSPVHGIVKGSRTPVKFSLKR